MAESSRKVLVYDLRVGGLFGRNRKPKSETFKLAEVDADKPLDTSILAPLVEAELHKIKLKPGGKFVVYRSAETIETRIMDGIEYTSRLIPVFGAATLQTGLIGEAGSIIFIATPQPA